ncbi:hypothetical protein EHF33_09775 [Deinococcus psychrotolerans]|uniref:Phosphodiester glycosidase domain-containing protein n=1 Tax=Deinococcus psychrotolerans TaxID=2489213 RepID=A0A3G8YDK0_9DEIO|nr:phosphodiester glycosidase family protein [Deinococcus psychrotolerans]AZI42993.1 hypothetical protein EHF33_09775 [Deinococcus psychrotolerans]
MNRLPTAARRPGLSLLSVRLAALVFMAPLTLAAARPVVISGVPTSPVIETKLLAGSKEGLPIWFLPQLGLQTRNKPQDVWLSYGPRSLRYTPQGGWAASGFALTAPLPAPERYGSGGSLHVGLDVLRALGVPLAGNAEQLDVRVVQAAREVPLPVPQFGFNLAPTLVTPKVVQAAKVPLSPKPSVPKPSTSKPDVAKPSGAKISINPTALKAVSAPTSPPPVSPPKAAPEKVKPVVKLPSPVKASPAVGHSGSASPLATSSAITSSTAVGPTSASPAAVKAAVNKAVTEVLELRAEVAQKPSLRSASIEPTPIAPPAGLLAPVPTSITPTPVAPPPVAPTMSAPTPLPAPTPPPLLSGPKIVGTRSSLSTVRNIQLQRLVIDLSGPATYSAKNERGGVTLFLPQVSADSNVQTLDSGDTLTLAPDSNGVTVRLDAGGGQSQVSTLNDPDRIVIDTATSLSADVPPPINPDALPIGVSLKAFGGLSLLSFDPAQFTPRVVAAPVGVALNVSELVRRVGGVAGVNGGYFDPPSSLPVDFVAAGGKLLAASLERRGTVGFSEGGTTLFGFPRPRYMLTGAFGSLMVNTVTARPAPKLLTAFVGDGKTAVGGAGLLTLTLNAAASGVSKAELGGAVPAAGRISLSFDPARFPQLPTAEGSSIQATLNYQSQEWQGVRDGLSAGPMLLQGGEIVLNPEREAFNVLTGVWRPTRQVAFAIYKGQPTLAFLEFGTPETFARALHNVGVTDALRLDSGSSATVFVSGGYLGTGGYLNTVWSRPVPNAIVLVPTNNTASLKASKNLK